MNVFTFLFIISAICSLDAFKTAVVPNEFIVHFHSKYFAPVRESYIAAKLLGSNVSLYSNGYIYTLNVYSPVYFKRIEPASFERHKRIFSDRKVPF